MTHVQMKDPLVVVGVDFGTTYSGFAYALWGENKALTTGSAAKAELYMTLEWPGQQFPYSKTPTSALYGGGNMTEWGWNAEVRRNDFPESFFVQRVKLHLQPQGDDVPEGRISFNPAEAAPLPPGITPLKIITDYLKAMKDFIFKTIAKSGVHAPPKDIRWCLTVPAIWTDHAKDLMTQAACHAGWVQGTGCPENEGSDHELEIVPEPEAASLWSLQSLREKSEKGAIDLNAAYLVVDLGGGTADLVMHGFRVTATTTRIVELTKGSGNLCGGSLLDDLFFKNIFGKKVIPNWLEIAKQYPGDAHRLRQNWNRKKHAFNGSEGVVIDIPPRLQKLVNKTIFPDVEDEETVKIPLADIKGIFDYVLGYIQCLIEDQVKTLRTSAEADIRDKPIVAFLVGGMSESIYIQTELKRTFEASMTVYTPPAPGAAIFRGAVVYGLNPSIFAARRARRTYGSEAMRVWNPMRDPDHLRVTTDGRELIKVVAPFVWKGNLVEADNWIQKEFVPINPDDRTISINLYSTELDKLKFPGEAGMTNVGVIKIDIPDGLPDKTIVLEMNYAGPTIKVRGYPKANPKSQATVAINLSNS